MDYYNRLAIVADSPETLRPVDIDRLALETGTDWPELRRWILDQPTTRRTRQKVKETIQPPEVKQ
jgi:hypothetical protein